MGDIDRTVEDIRRDFNIPEDVEIERAEKFSEVAPSGFTCITIGQLEAGLKIPLYHPERPLQYEILRQLSRAPGQMHANFFRLINEFEEYNRTDPGKKFSAEKILELHTELPVHVNVTPHCFCIRKKRNVKLPVRKDYSRKDNRDWHKFPIFISGNWIHHPDLPPPPEKYFEPTIWRLFKNSTAVEEKTPADENEKSTSRINSDPLESNLKISVMPVDKSRSSSKLNAATVLSSEDEETSLDENHPVLKRQRKASEAPTQVGLCSSAGIDFSEVSSNVDPIQRVIDIDHTDADHRNSVENESGPWFEELEGESDFSRTGAWKGLTNIGNFPVLEKFAGLYKQIWQRHGHLATRKLIKTSTFMLVVAVTELLEFITIMATVKLAELDASHLNKWDEKIAEAEGYKFEVGWLRKHFDEVRKTLDSAFSLSNSIETHEKALKAGLKKESAACAKLNALKVQFEKAEQELGQVKLEVIQHQQAVSKDLAEREQYTSFLEKTFLQDAV